MMYRIWSSEVNIEEYKDFLDEYTGDSRVHIKGELYDNLAKQLRDTLENWR